MRWSDLMCSREAADALPPVRLPAPACIHFAAAPGLWGYRMSHIDDDPGRQHRQGWTGAAELMMTTLNEFNKQVIKRRQASV